MNLCHLYYLYKHLCQIYIIYMNMLYVITNLPKAMLFNIAFRLFLIAVHIVDQIQIEERLIFNFK